MLGKAGFDIYCRSVYHLHRKGLKKGGFVSQFSRYRALFDSNHSYGMKSSILTLFLLIGSSRREEKMFFDIDFIKITLSDHDRSEKYQHVSIYCYIMCCNAWLVTLSPREAEIRRSFSRTMTPKLLEKNGRKGWFWHMM